MTIPPSARIAGASFFLGTTVIILLGLMAPSALDSFITRRSDPKRNTFVHSVDIPVRTAGPMALSRSFLEIRYPKQMRENETRVVEMTYRVRSVLVIKQRPLEQSDKDVGTESWMLEEPISVHLGSSGFKLDPKEDLRKEPGTLLPLRQKWTITPEGEGTRVLLLRFDLGENPGTKTRFPFTPKPLDASINGQKIPLPEDGWFELPITVTNYWGISRKAASASALISGFIGFLLGWPVVTSLIGSRRSVRCRVHTGFFKNRECAFVNVLNQSVTKEVELTHVWFQTTPQVDIINADRPLPKRLRPDESWETWIQLSELPKRARRSCFDKARVRLSTGQVIQSAKAADVRPRGSIPGSYDSGETRSGLE